MYDKLTQYLSKKGLNLKADENKISKEAVLKEYQTKDKIKKLTIAERIDRIEKIIGITEPN